MKLKKWKWTIILLVFGVIFGVLALLLGLFEITEIFAQPVVIIENLIGVSTMTSHWLISIIFYSLIFTLIGLIIDNRKRMF